MKKTLVAMLVVGLVAVAAQAGAVHYSFDEVASGTWEVNVTVTGGGVDTTGLSAYGLWVFSPGVSYAENTLGTFGVIAGGLVGFQTPNLVTGYIGADFNAGNFQSATAAIHDIGITNVDVISLSEALFPSVHLGVPALLGTLTTPTGLGLAHFSNDSKSGLYNLTGEGTGFFSGDVTTTFEVNPIPEPATMTLIGLGGLALIRRRRR